MTGAVIIGGGTLAVRCLEILLERKVEVPLVVATKSDSAQSSWQLSLSEAAGRRSIPAISPSKLKDVADEVKSAAPDVIFSVHCDMLISKEILSIPPKGVINFHFALLPRHRGMYPGLWAILSGDEKAGVTLHYVDSGIDTGDIIAQAEVPIAADATGRSLYDDTVEAAASLFAETLPSILNGTAQKVRQDESLAVYHDKGSIDFSDRRIRWDSDAAALDRKLRAFSFPPYQHAHFFAGNKKVEVAVCEFAAASSPPGRVMEINKKGVVISTVNGGILVKSAIVEGKMIEGGAFREIFKVGDVVQ